MAGTFGSTMGTFGNGMRGTSYAAPRTSSPTTTPRLPYTPSTQYPPAPQYNQTPSGMGSMAPPTKAAPLSPQNQYLTQLANNMQSTMRSGQPNPVPTGYQIGSSAGYEPIPYGGGNWTANYGDNPPDTNPLSRRNLNHLRNAAGRLVNGIQPEEDISRDRGDGRYISRQSSQQEISGETGQPYANQQYGYPGGGPNPNDQLQSPAPQAYGSYQPWQPPPQNQGYGGGYTPNQSAQPPGSPGAIPQVLGPLSGNPANQASATNPYGWIEDRAEGGSSPGGIPQGQTSNVAQGYGDLFRDAEPVRRGYSALDANGQGIGTGYDLDSVDENNPPPPGIQQPGFAPTQPTSQPPSTDDPTAFQAWWQSQRQTGPGGYPINTYNGPQVRTY